MIQAQDAAFHALEDYFEWCLELGYSVICGDLWLVLETLCEALVWNPGTSCTYPSADWRMQPPCNAKAAFRLLLTRTVCTCMGAASEKADITL